MPKRLLILLVLICLLYICRAQDSLTTLDKVINFPSSFFAKANKQMATLENRLTRQTSTYLQLLAKRDKKLQHKLSKVK